MAFAGLLTLEDGLSVRGTLEVMLQVMGPQARSAALVHALVGSVAEWVIAAAPCDVLVARPRPFTFELP